MLCQRRLRQSAYGICRRHFSQHVIRQQQEAMMCPNGRDLDEVARTPIESLKVRVKANIVCKDVPEDSSNAVASSKMLQGYRSPFDATVVKLLKDAGVASHNFQSGDSMDEFGMGSHSQHAHEGAVQSIYSRRGIALSPGGSSGGSAVSVAKGACEVALGTDTGGSVRLPAAYMGVLGFKPSYGRISRWGLIQYANSLDTVGILARHIGHLQTVFSILDQHDPQDQTSLSSSLRRRIRSMRPHKLETLRIGIPLEYNIQELSPVVRKTYLATLNTLCGAGHTLHPVSLPSTRSALSAYYVLAPAEASSNLAKYDGIRYGHRTTTPTDASPHANPALPLYARTRHEGFGEEVKRRILLGAYTLSSEAMDNYFIQAQRVRRLVQQDFDRVFAQQNPLLSLTTTSEEDQRKVDLLLTPTAPTLPPTIEELTMQSPLESYMNDVFTVPASLAGLPAISIPAPLPDKERSELESTDVRTAGMQLIGQFGDDHLVLDAAQQLYHELLGEER